MDLLHITCGWPKLSVTVRHEHVMGVARILLINASIVLEDYMAGPQRTTGATSSEYQGMEQRGTGTQRPYVCAPIQDTSSLAISGAQPFVGASRQGGGVSGGSHMSGLEGIIKDSLTGYYRLQGKRAHLLP